MIGTREEPTPELSSPMTAEQLLTYHAPDKRVELVRGTLVVCEPPGWQHGEVMVQLAVFLSHHLSQEQHREGWPHPRGRLACGDPGFILFRGPDTVRAPDLAYVARERLGAAPPRGFPELAPDLAVEIRSPTDRAGAELAKVSDWLLAGSRLVWVIDPGRQQAVVYRADGTVTVLHANAEANAEANAALQGEDVLPGFTCALRALLPEA